ncbi:hypothetical protein D3C84_743210 [compost metagenome]
MGLSILATDDAGVGGQAAGFVRCDQAAADVADTDESQGIGVAVELGNGQGAAAGADHGVVDVFEQQQRRSERRQGEYALAGAGGALGFFAVTEAVDHQGADARAVKCQVPDIATGWIVVQRMLADADASVRCLVAARIQPRQQHGAPGVGIDIEHFGLARHRPKTDALGAASGEPVGQARVQIEALGAIDGEYFDPGTRSAWQDPQVQFAPGGMLENVAGQLCGHQRHTAGIGGVETVFFRQLLRGASRVADLAAVFDWQHLGH